MDDEFCSRLGAWWLAFQKAIELAGGSFHQRRQFPGSFQCRCKPLPSGAPALIARWGHISHGCRKAPQNAEEHHSKSTFRRLAARLLASVLTRFGVTQNYLFTVQLLLNRKAETQNINPRRMASTQFVDHLLSHLSVHVSGPPNHSQPLELFYPTLRNYRGDQIRAVPSDLARDGYAVVQDKDIMSMWRLPSVVAAYEVYF